MIQNLQNKITMQFHTKKERKVMYTKKGKYSACYALHKCSINMTISVYDNICDD